MLMYQRKLRFYAVIVNLMLIRIFKAIMKRSKFKNKANRTKLQGDVIKYEKQRNLVVKLK